MEKYIMVKEMVERINEAIDEFNEDYKECNSLAVMDEKRAAKNRIKGMLDMLEVVTGKNYIPEVFKNGKVLNLK